MGALICAGILEPKGEEEVNLWEVVQRLKLSRILAGGQRLFIMALSGNNGDIANREGER